MTKYRYNQQVNPPAPFVHVTLRRPDGERELARLPALLDPAADRSVMPEQFVADLQLQKLSETAVAGFGGHVSIVHTYAVEVTIHHRASLLAERIASPGEPYVLLGRDILNHCRILLDGPQLALEIE